MDITPRSSNDIAAGSVVPDVTPELAEKHLGHTGDNKQQHPNPFRSSFARSRSEGSTTSSTKSMRRREARVKLQLA